MGRGPSARVGSTGSSSRRSAPCPQTAQQRNSTEAAVVRAQVTQAFTMGPSLHGLSLPPSPPASLEHTHTGGQWTSALGSSHMSGPHVWATPTLAAAQATPTQGTKRPLSTFGPFLRPLLAPLLLLPLPAFTLSSRTPGQEERNTDECDQIS